MPKDLKKDYDAFNTLCLFENNYKNLREKIAKSEKPLLPLMGTCSKDLFLAFEYNSSKEYGLDNFKLRIMFGVISEFAGFQPNLSPPLENIDSLLHAKLTSINRL